MAFCVLPSLCTVLWKPFLASAEWLLCGISDTASTEQRLGFLRLADEDWKGAYSVSPYNRLQRTLPAIEADRMQCECHATFWRCAGMQRSHETLTLQWPGGDRSVHSGPSHGGTEQGRSAHAWPICRPLRSADAKARARLSQQISRPPRSTERKQKRVKRRKAVESVAPVTGTTRCRLRTAEAVAARGNGRLRAD